MMTFNPLIIIYALPLALLWLAWTFAARRRSARDRAVLEDNRRAGLMEPNTLHPVIDPAVCLGCKSCLNACPEGDILGVIDGKAMLIEPTLCVGHGACQAACPTGAISLVFGTATRGVDIPMVSPDFETSVPGIFIAGELGGMGLIKNAVEQGRQAMDSIVRRSGKVRGGAGVLDVVIVGCGPAGISASLGAMQHKLSFVTIEQATLGGTVAHFPRGKVVMTSPAKLPLIGEMRFAEVSKEALLAYWRDVLDRTGLQPRFEEQVTGVTRDGEIFTVATTHGTYRAKSVLLAIGRRGTPRTLDVPGEDLAKVVYRLIDAEQYAGRRVLVVGGGDSAIEAAVQLSAQPGTRVTLSYRGGAYTRARAKNRDRLAELVAGGRVEQLLDSRVLRIAHDSVELECAGELRMLANDDVIVCAGGILPTGFLLDLGIRVETKFGTA